MYTKGSLIALRSLIIIVFDRRLFHCEFLQTKHTLSYKGNMTIMEGNVIRNPLTRVNQVVRGRKHQPQYMYFQPIKYHACNIFNRKCSGVSLKKREYF